MVFLFLPILFPVFQQNKLIPSLPLRQDMHGDHSSAAVGWGWSVSQYWWVKGRKSGLLMYLKTWTLNHTHEVQCKVICAKNTSLFMRVIKQNNSLLYTLEKIVMGVSWLFVFIFLIRHRLQNSSCQWSLKLLASYRLTIRPTVGHTHLLDSTCMKNMHIGREILKKTLLLHCPRTFLFFCFSALSVLHTELKFWKKKRYYPLKIDLWRWYWKSKIRSGAMHRHE